MRKTILVVHGMRKGKLNETLLNFIHQTFNSDEIDYEVAFLESEEILLDEVIQQTVDLWIFTYSSCAVIIVYRFSLLRRYRSFI